VRDFSVKVLGWIGVAGLLTSVFLLPIGLALLGTARTAGHEVSPRARLMCIAGAVWNVAMAVYVIVTPECCPPRGYLEGEGYDKILLLSLPAALALLPTAFSTLRPFISAALISALLMYLFCALGSMTNGLLFIPGAVALQAAAVGSLIRVRTRDHPDKILRR
jgi:hypothetical protein